MLNCSNCEFCYDCQNLNWKKYYIQNKEYSKQDYFEKIKNIKISKSKKNINKYSQIKNSTNCSGDYFIDSNNCENCFQVEFAEDCKNSWNLWRNAKDVYDCDTVWMNSELVYESINTAISSFKNLFCNRCWTVNNSFYCDNCDNSSNLFWCVWLRNKEYCILNKQYTKQEYEKIIPKIIEHMCGETNALGVKTPLLTKEGQGEVEWWEFFPSSISPFWYNETVAQEYFPLKPPVFTDIPLIKGEKTSKTNLGGFEFNWSSYKQPCLERMKLRNPRKLFDRKCDKCKVDIKSTYFKNREEVVYCEGCYESDFTDS